MRYQYDVFGWYVGVADNDAVRLSTRVAPTNTSLSQTEGLLRSNWSGRGWVELPYKYQELPSVVEQTSIGIPPIKFKLLFKTSERVAIYGLKGSDALINDFLSLLDDVRLTEVRLDEETTKEATTYAINAIKADPSINYDQAEADARTAEILAGTPPQGA